MFLCSGVDGLFAMVGSDDFPHRFFERVDDESEGALT
jgi:hypothetical protein